MLGTGKFRPFSERGNRHGVSFVKLPKKGRQITNKTYVGEVQSENNGKFNYYTECISDENKMNKKLKA
mgnify:CR=1 FL=1